MPAASATVAKGCSPLVKVFRVQVAAHRGYCAHVAAFGTPPIGLSWCRSFCSTARRCKGLSALRHGLSLLVDPKHIAPKALPSTRGAPCNRRETEELE